MQRVSRRHFLSTLASVGLAPASTADGTKTPTPQKDAGQQLIDVHHHILPPFWLEARKLVAGAGSAGAEWTVEKTLAEMDRNGVAAAVVSITTPGIWFGDVPAARTLARRCNEYASQLVRDHRGRFGFFAAVPLPDTEGTLREIAYALDVLKADGIGLMTSYGNKWPGDPAFAAAFDELDRRRAIVYFHPTTADCCRNLMSYVPDRLIEFPHETSRAIASLVYSGSLSRLRRTRFIFSHAGGTVPMLAGRIAELGSWPDVAGKTPNGVEYELRRLYYEIANSANRAAMAALTHVVPKSQILFGSDYPFVPVGTTASGLAALGLPSHELDAIRRGNAAALFPRFN